MCIGLFILKDPDGKPEGLYALYLDTQTIIQ